MSETIPARGPDILVRSAPQLSATSDAPLATPDSPPVSASNNTDDHDAGVPTEMSPEAQAAVTRRTAPDAEADKAAKQPDPDPDLDTMDVDGRKIPTPPWAKREITKARNKQREAQALADTNAKELAELRAKFEDLATKVPPVPAKDAATETKPIETTTTETSQPTQAEARPTRDQFDDPDAYDTALSEWAERQGERRAEQKLAAERTAAEAAQRAQTEQAVRAAQEAEVVRITADWTTQTEAAQAKYPDFAEVVGNPNLKISDAMAHALALRQNGAETAYHLAKNATEAERIFAITNPARQMMEIAVLADRLAAPPARRAARPRPLDPIDTGTAPADGGDREESMEEVATRVNTRYQTQRRPFISASEARR